jgi:hypothetical protein
MTHGQARARRFTRRQALGLAAGGVLAGLGGGAAWVAMGQAADRWGRFAAGPGNGQPARFPAWVSRTPKSRNGYIAAYANLDLMATLPCFCGCDSLAKPHASLRECFVQPNGEIEDHGSGCETCLDEALDAARWAREGVPWPEIRARIVTAYADRLPERGGNGCESACEG